MPGVDRTKRVRYVWRMDRKINLAQLRNQRRRILDNLSFSGAGGGVVHMLLQRMSWNERVGAYHGIQAQRIYPVTSRVLRLVLSCSLFSSSMCAFCWVECRVTQLNHEGTIILSRILKYRNMMFMSCQCLRSRPRTEKPKYMYSFQNTERFSSQHRHTRSATGVEVLLV